MGTGEVDPEPRTQAQREARIRAAHRAGWPELPRKSLRFERFGGVTDERDGTRYTITKGEIDADFSSNVVAFFYTEHGDPIFLEEAPA